MPLPDERPRASVANLIGRFEQQQKKQPGSNGSSSRPGSVISHTTGDSAKEETKVAREWPPVQTPSLTRSTSGSGSPPSSSIRQSMTFASPPVPVKELLEAAQEAAIVPDDILPAEANGKRASGTNGADTPTVRGTPAPAPAPAPGTPSSKPKINTSVRQSTSSKTTPARATGPSSLSKSTSRLSAPPAPKTPVTPSRPKTPSRAKTPAGRPSTGVSRPPVTPSRAKTPSASTPAQQTRSPGSSSNLFAPTAASLARSRNAPPVPASANTGPKKVPDLSRLSKPTASSASRTRTPAVVSSTPRGRGAPPKRGTPTTRGAGSGRGATPRKAAAPTAAKAVAAGAAAVGASSAAAAENDHTAESAGGENHDVDLVEESTHEEHVHTDEEHVQEDHVQPHEDEPTEAVEHVEEPISVDPASDLHHADEVDAVAEDDALEEAVHTEDVGDEKEPHVQDDLEDMVSMLEGTKLSETPVVAGEIPDEE